MKKVFLTHLLAFTLFILFISGCGNSASEKEAAELDSLKTFFLVVKDSIDSTWHFMMAEDDLRLNLLKRLLEEIKNTRSFDEEEVNGLMARIDDAKAIRYDQASMQNQTLIDEYDFALSSLIKEVTALARSNAMFQNFPNMAQLIDNITELDNRVLLHRVHYDFFAKDYNKFITDHGELVKQIDSNDPQNEINLFEIRE